MKIIKSLGKLRIILIAILAAILIGTCSAALAINVYAASSTEIEIMSDSDTGITVYLEFDKAPSYSGSGTSRSPYKFNRVPTQVRVNVSGDADSSNINYRIVYGKMTMPGVDMEGNDSTFDYYFMREDYAATEVLSKSYNQKFDLTFAQDGTYIISYELCVSSGKSLVENSKKESYFKFEDGLLNGALITQINGYGEGDIQAGGSQNNWIDTSLLYIDKTTGETYGEFQIALGFDEAPTDSNGLIDGLYDTMPSFLLISIPDGYDDYGLMITCFYGIIDSVEVVSADGTTYTLTPDSTQPREVKRTGHSSTHLVAGRYIQNDLNKKLKKDGLKYYTTVRYDFPSLKTGMYSLQIKTHDTCTQTSVLNGWEIASQRYQAFTYNFYYGNYEAPDASYYAGEITSSNLSKDGDIALYYGATNWGDSDPEGKYMGENSDGLPWFTTGYCTDEIYATISPYTLRDITGDITTASITVAITYMKWTSGKNTVTTNDNDKKNCVGTLDCNSLLATIPFPENFTTSPPNQGTVVSLTVQAKWKKDGNTYSKEISLTFEYGMELTVYGLTNKSDAPKSVQEYIESAVCIVEAYTPIKLRAYDPVQATKPGQKDRTAEGVSELKGIDGIGSAVYYMVSNDGVTNGELKVIVYDANEEYCEDSYYIDHSIDYKDYTYYKLEDLGDDCALYLATRQTANNYVVTETVDDVKYGEISQNAYIDTRPVGVKIVLPATVINYNISVTIASASDSPDSYEADWSGQPSTEFKTQIWLIWDTAYHLNSKMQDGKYTLTFDINGAKFVYEFTYDPYAPEFVAISSLSDEEEYGGNNLVREDNNALPIHTGCNESTAIYSYIYYSNTPELYVTDNIGIYAVYFDYTGNGKYTPIDFYGATEGYVDLEDLDDGEYSFYIVDMAGNSTIMRPSTFVLDTERPSAWVDTEHINDTNGYIDVTYSDDVTRVYLTSDEDSYNKYSHNPDKWVGNTFVLMTAGKSYVRFSVDTHFKNGDTLYIVAVDRAGNVSEPASGGIEDQTSNWSVGIDDIDNGYIDIDEGSSKNIYAVVTDKSDTGRTYTGEYSWYIDESYSEYMTGEVELTQNGVQDPYVTITGLSAGQVYITVELKIYQGYNITCTFCVIVNHIKDEEKYIPPTCESAGYYICPVCDNEFTDGKNPALGHDYSIEIDYSKLSYDKVELTLEDGTCLDLKLGTPTCTQGAIKIYKCCRCGYIDYDEDGISEDCIAIIDSLGGHIWDEGTVIKEPTENEDGEILYTCTVCGETKMRKGDDKHECLHESLTWTTVEPTCGSTGYELGVCDVCGALCSYKIIPATGEHVWGEPTYGSYTDGSYTYTYKCYKCEVCGATNIEIIYTETIPVIGPVIYTVTISPGNAQFKLEDDDDSVWIEAVVTMVGDDEYAGDYIWTSSNESVAKVTGYGKYAKIEKVGAGTCDITVTVDDGKTVKTAVCRVTVLKETGGGILVHSHAGGLGASWNVTEDGATLVWDDSQAFAYVNGQFISSGSYFVGACGEYYVVISCRGCEDYEEYYFVLSHNYAEVVTVEATCTTGGYTRLYCTRVDCDNYNPVSATTADASNHKYELVTIQEATCETDGIAQFVCSECGNVADLIYTSALGHIWSDLEYVPTTCRENPTSLEESGGYMYRHCTREGCSEEEITPIEGALPSDHSYGAWETTIPATCEEAGERVRYCSVCGHAEYSEIAATGHSFVVYSIREEVEYDDQTGETIVIYYETDECEYCHLLSAEYKIEESKTVAEQIVEFFESYQTYIWWILLVCVAAWSIFFGVRYAVSRDDGEAKAVSRQIVNYILGILIIAAICVAVPYLIYGVAAFIA